MLVTFKSLCTISGAEDFACSARFLQENDEFKNEGKNSNTALIMDNKSRHSFMLGDLATEVALDTEYRISLVYR